MAALLDQLIAALAARQRGCVTRRQLLDLGLTTSMINYRLRIGRLHRVYPGVYAVGHPAGHRRTSRRRPCSRPAPVPS